MTFAIPLLATLALGLSGGDSPPPVEPVGSAGTLGLLIGNRLIQEELHLDEGQVRRCVALNDQTDQRMKATARAFRDRESKHKDQDAREIDRAFAKETREAIHAIFSAPQYARLVQISLQVGTVATFLDPSVSAALKLDEAQARDLQTIQDDARHTLQTELREGKLTNAGLRHRASELRKEGREKALDRLTSEQRQIWETLIGPPFLLGQDESKAARDADKD